MTLLFEEFRLSDCKRIACSQFGYGNTRH